MTAGAGGDRDRWAPREGAPSEWRRGDGERSKELGTPPAPPPPQLAPLRPSKQKRSFLPELPFLTQHTFEHPTNPPTPQGPPPPACRAPRGPSRSQRTRHPGGGFIGGGWGRLEGPLEGVLRGGGRVLASSLGAVPEVSFGGPAPKPFPPQIQNWTESAAPQKPQALDPHRTHTHVACSLSPSCARKSPRRPHPDTPPPGHPPTARSGRPGA